MAQDFSDFVDTIDALMEDFGGTATLNINRDSGVYDPTIGANVFVSYNIAVLGILADYSLQSNGEGTKAKTLIKAGDKVFYCKPPTTLPSNLQPDTLLGFDSTEDSLTISGIVYKVVTTKIVRPSIAALAVPLLYEIYLKR